MIKFLLIYLIVGFIVAGFASQAIESFDKSEKPTPVASLVLFVLCFLCWPLYIFLFLVRELKTSNKLQGVDIRINFFEWCLIPQRNCNFIYWLCFYMSWTRDHNLG